MFEATIRDRSDELIFEQEIAETGGVNADVAALLVACSITGGEVALVRSCAAGRGYLGRLNLLVGVVDEIFLVRHGELGDRVELGVFLQW